MKIKHFAGYGSVTATKVSKSIKNGIAKICIRVEGNHERGICRRDTYDVHSWLLSKFAKDCKDDRDILDIEYNEWEKKLPNGCDVDCCDYVITYEVARKR